MFIVTSTVHKYMKYVNSDVISPSIAQPPRPSSVGINWAG